MFAMMLPALATTWKLNLRGTEAVISCILSMTPAVACIFAVGMGFLRCCLCSCNLSGVEPSAAWRAWPTMRAESPAPHRNRNSPGLIVLLICAVTVAPPSRLRVFGATIIVHPWPSHAMCVNHSTAMLYARPRGMVPMCHRQPMLQECDRGIFQTFYPTQDPSSYFAFVLW